MFRRIPLYGWVAIVICLVAIVYIQWPALTARTMYEGYADAAKPASAEASVVPDAIRAQLNAAHDAPDAIQAQLNAAHDAPDAIQAQLNAAHDAPSVVPDAIQAQLNATDDSPAFAPASDTNAKLDAVIEALNRLADAKKPGKSVPEDADSMQSQPADALYQPDSKASLQQGASFSAGCPKPRPDADAAPSVPAQCTGAAPARPCPRCPYCKQYSPCGCRRKPDSSPNPVCPDLRDYVRKDSIPCWGCKLK